MTKESIFNFFTTNTEKNFLKKLQNTSQNLGYRREFIETYKTVETTVTAKACVIYWKNTQFNLSYDYIFIHQQILTHI